MITTRRTTTVWLAALMALLLAACGGGTDDGDTETEATPVEDTAAEEVDPDGPTDDPAEAVGDGADETDGTDEATDAATDGQSGGDDANPAPPESLVTAAEEEGSLVFYSVPDESIAQGIAEEFMQRYDIEVEFVRLVSADLAQRFSAEADAGAPAADLILVSDSPFLAEAYDNDWLVPLADAGVEIPAAFPEEFVILDGKSAIVSINATVLGYNTDLVDSPPTDWTALAEEAANGNLAISDPTTSVANVFFWSLIREEYGDELLEGIAANDPTFTGGAVPSAQSLAAGEVAYATPMVSAILDNLISDGAPVDYVLPDVTTGAEIAVGLTQGATNPNAAALFAHFILTQEGNELLTVPYNTSSPYGTNLPAEYTRANPAALESAEEIYALLGAG